jgi:hypothetical protein
MKDAFAQESKSGPPIALPFDEFQLGHMAFHHGVVDVPGEPRLDGGFVPLYSSSKALQFWQTTMGNLL